METLQKVQKYAKNMIYFLSNKGIFAILSKSSTILHNNKKKNKTKQNKNINARAVS